MRASSSRWHDEWQELAEEPTSVDVVENTVNRRLLTSVAFYFMLTSGVAFSITEAIGW